MRSLLQDRKIILSWNTNPHPYFCYLRTAACAVQDHQYHPQHNLFLIMSVQLCIRPALARRHHHHHHHQRVQRRNATTRFIDFIFIFSFSSKIFFILQRRFIYLAQICLSLPLFLHTHCFAWFCKKNGFVKNIFFRPLKKWFLIGSTLARGRGISIL